MELPNNPKHSLGFTPNVILLTDTIGFFLVPNTWEISLAFTTSSIFNIREIMRHIPGRIALVFLFLFAHLDRDCIQKMKDLLVSLT